MTNDQVHEAVIQWIAGITGRTTIATYQSGPRPALPYIAVNMPAIKNVREHEQDIDFSPERADEAAPIEDTGGDLIYPDVTATPIIETEWHFSVHAFGNGVGNVLDLLRPIDTARRLAQKQEPLMPALTIHDASPIRDLTEWINEAWEPRAQVDLFVRGLVKDGFVIDTIDDIEGFDIEREG